MFDFKCAVVLLFSVVFFAKTDLGLGQARSCVQCTGGYNTNCARDVVPINLPCMGTNANCYEALVIYQNGTLPLVQRRCYNPRPGRPTFCDGGFSSKVGILLDCRTCYTDNCNNHNYIRQNPNSIDVINRIIFK